MFGIDDALILGGLSAGGSLLSGLGGRSAAKSQEKRNAAYLAAQLAYNKNVSESMLAEVPRRIAPDAELAGFNPVTWLQGGALGYYTNAYQMRLQNAPQESVNIPSVMSAVGGALSSFSEAFGTQYRADQKLNLAADQFGQQMDLARDKLDIVKAKLGRGGGGGGGVGSLLSGTDAAIYGAAGSASSRGAGGLLSVSALTRGAGGGYDIVGNPSDRNPFAAFGVVTRPGMPSQDKVEQEYGGALGELYGVYHGFDDFTRRFGSQKLGAWDTIQRGLNTDMGPVVKDAFDYLARDVPFYGSEWTKRNSSDGGSRLRVPDHTFAPMAGAGFGD